MMYFMKKIYLLFLLAISFYNVQAYNLLAYWDFNNQISDSGINSLTSVNNGVTFVSDRFGNGASAAHFDGNSSILVQGYNNTSASEITYTFWVKMDDLTSSVSSVLQGSNHHTISIGHYLSSGTFVHSSFFAGMDNTSLDNDMSSDPTPSDLVENQWVFLAVTNDGTTTRLYIDGVLESEYNETLETNNGDLTIGDNLNTQRDVSFKGAMDDLKIYDTALSAEELLDELVTSTEEITKSTHIRSVYPNPTKGSVSIRFDSYQKSVITEVSDLTGRLTQSTNFMNIESINLNLNEPAGIYFLTIISDEKKTRIRLIKR